ncbi:hypothetical protein BST61_g5708 [Cercospora zeina]
MPSIYKRSSKPLPKAPKHASVVRVHYSYTLDELTDDEDDENEPDEAKGGKRRPWRPITLRAGFLTLMGMLTGALILVVIWLLVLSGRKQGVIFARDINALPLSRSFAYLYLPTLTSVIYSFLWTWVDLDIRRLEPYFQLSKDSGASGDSSLLLSYPLEFLVTLPFLASKNRHWAVLAAAVTMMLVFWGLTPAQAGIFATRIVTVTELIPASQGLGYTPINKQGNVSTIYAQSVYNIAWLNESLLPFMTKQYVLRAFGPSLVEAIDTSNMTYMATTAMYSVDVSCEDVTLWDGPRGMSYNTTSGCSFYAPPIRPYGGNDTSKPFDTMYVGYQNENGAADYYLSSACNESFEHSFFVRWSHSTPSAILSGNLSEGVDPELSNMTALFCEPTYYQQEVQATITLPNARVISMDPTGIKQPLPTDMFNTTSFEWLMSAGADITSRGYYPATTFPNQQTHLMDTALNLEYLPKMAPFAIAMHQRPLEAYLDPETLRSSYQAAYRLLFARQLTDILEKYHDTDSNEHGTRSYTIEAVVVVPAFAYAAIGILGTVFLIAVALAIKIPKRCNKLRKDPATLGAVMDLIAASPTATHTFCSLSDASTAGLEQAVGKSAFRLEAGRDDASMVRLRVAGQNTLPSSQSPTERQPSASPQYGTDPEQSKGHRPFEMKIAIGWIFFILQFGATITFAVLFAKAKGERGLALPFQSTFMRQLLENYIPIALATFIEPFWLILNRLLCLLQPYEQLRKGNSRACRSVDLDYSSLPPQFLFWRAARAKHWLIFLLCFMVLSANVLSIALSGLMYEDAKGVSEDVKLGVPRTSAFVNLNGLGLPFNTLLEGNWQGGTTSDQFYRLMSNLTADTPLPPWLDEEYTYLAIDTTGTNTSSTIRTQTLGFGATLQCRTVQEDEGESVLLEFNASATNATLEVTLRNDDGSLTNCEDNESAAVASYRSLRSVLGARPGHLALELASMLTSNDTASDDLFCRQHILAGWIRADLVQDGDHQQLGLPVMNITSRNDTLLVCRPLIETITAELEVDSTGRVMRQISAHSLQNDSASYADLIAQVHQFMPDMGATWHSDSFPSDFLNYLIAQSTGDSTMLVPSLPIPSISHASQQLATLYRRLFAILIGTNQDVLFEPDTSGTTTTAQIITPQIRIVFSTPAFIVVEAIFTCYLITTIIFYTRRPWKVLPRLPSSIASNIAFFAASNALKDLAHAEHCSAEHAKAARQAWTWGFGSFIGTDGRLHVGIDRDPFVAVLQSEKLPQPPPYTP